MSSLKVFVTGGAGFIGRWVVQQCLERGHEVVVYDNLCAGSMDHLLEFVDDIAFYEADILDMGSLQAAFEEQRPDAVVHLAAHHFIPFCNAHPQETLRVNVEGTYAVLDAAARAGARKAVVASSGAIYPSVDELIEETLAPAPVDVYGLSKLMTEQVTEHVARTTEMACVAARLFNTYGPYETNPHLIPDIFDGLRSGPSVDLGNIYTKRDYIYVEDVARLLVRAAEVVEDGYQAVNVGTGVDYSAEEIVRQLGRLLGSDIDIHVDPERVRKVDKMYQRADTTRLQQLTGTKAEYDLEAGLRRLVDHERLTLQTV